MPQNFNHGKKLGLFPLINVTEAETQCSNYHLAKLCKARNTSPYGAFDANASQGRGSPFPLLRQTAFHRLSPRTEKVNPTLGMETQLQEAQRNNARFSPILRYI